MHRSARSIIAEYLLKRLADGGFSAHSAGSFPKGEVHRQTLQLLTEAGHDVSNARSKSWDEFTSENAPRLDFIFTVCDNIANESCPVWPGQPITAHWGIPDPAAMVGSEAEIATAFTETYQLLNDRIREFCRTPFAELDEPTLRERMVNIGRQ